MLTFYTYAPHNWNASFYYRLFVPFWTARDLGLPIRVHVDTNDGAIDMQEKIRAFCESDIALLYQPIGGQVLNNVRIAKSFIPSLRDGDWKYPPTVVVDTDDNLFNVSPYNPAFKHLGHRDHDGKDLKRGHLIGDVRDGQRRVLWKDGDKGFDIVRNREEVASHRHILNLSDAVTCSTPHVASTVREESLARRIRVFPNLVRFDHYEQPRLEQDPARINILWQGGASHYEDWYPLRESLGRITTAYPEAHWLIWGQLYPWVTSLIPPDRYTFIGWCPYQEYKLRLAMMNHDINLAPLSESRFNRCRSAIKFYEGSVLRKDVPTLAQNVGPYRDEIVPEETGLLFNTPEEFEAQLATLIENADLRKRIGRNAKDWVHEHRDAMKEAPRQFAFFEELREMTKRETPHMPEEEWPKFEREAEVAHASL